MGNESDKTIQMDNRTTVSSKESKERLVLLALEKADYQKLDEFQDQNASLDHCKKKELRKYSQLVETKSNRTSVISKTSSGRRLLYLKVKPLKEQRELQDSRN